MSSRRNRTIKYIDGKIKYKKDVGINSKIIDCEIQRENKAKHIEMTDGDNRIYIRELIVNNIRNGKTEEEALDIAIKDKVAEKFEYLENNGLNKRECFRNWARNYMKRKEKQQGYINEK